MWTGDSWGRGKRKVLKTKASDGDKRRPAILVEVVRVGNSMFCVFYIKRKAEQPVQQGLGAGDRNTTSTAKGPGGCAVSKRLLETLTAP